jgi:uroporphyrinogen-III synthase
MGKALLIMPDTLNGYGIAITRPLGQATKLAELIKKQSGRPVLFPLIAIAPLDDYSAFEQQLTGLEKYHWAIFISSNAVQNAMPRLLAKFGSIPKKLKFAAIGPITAAELAEFGTTDVLTPQNRFDSESLLALPEMHAVANKNILIFRGIGGRDVLSDGLKARGATVDFAECYQRVNPQSDGNILSALWQNDELHAVIVTSSEAMRHLLDIADKGNAAWIRGVTLCVNHARIAEIPLQRGLKVSIADAPGDESMLQCLIKALSH